MWGPLSFFLFTVKPPSSPKVSLPENSLKQWPELAWAHQLSWAGLIHSTVVIGALGAVVLLLLPSTTAAIS